MANIHILIRTILTITVSAMTLTSIAQDARSLITAGNFPLPFLHSKKNITIKGNIKKLYKNPADADVFSFQYDDLISNQRIVIPVSKDTAGNFTVTFQINGYQEIDLSQAVLFDSEIRHTGSSDFSFFAKPGQTIEFDYYISADHKIYTKNFKGIDAGVNNQTRAYRDALAASEFDPLIDFALSDSLIQGLDVFKKYASRRLKEGLVFNRKYFKAHKVQEFVKQQADFEMYYSVGQRVLFTILHNRLSDSTLNDFFKENSIKINNPQAYGNYAYKNFLSQYYSLLEHQVFNKATDININLADLASFILANHPELTATDRSLALKLTDTIKKPENVETEAFYPKKFIRIIRV